MAYSTVQIQELARVGAAARLKELAEEIEAIREAFPEIGKTEIGKTEKVSLPRVKASTTNGQTPKDSGKRAGWSAAARKAVSLRMKKYWAAKRKAAAA